MRRKYDLFLSYSYSDKEYAEKAKELFQNNSLTLFDPMEDIKPGNNLKDKIEVAINNCEYFVLISTKESLLRYYINICHPNGGSFSSIEEEVLYASKISASRGIKIVPLIIIDNISSEKDIQLLVEDVFMTNEKAIIGNFDIIINKAIYEIKRYRRKIELQSAADQYAVFGSYQDAIECYTALLHILDENLDKDEFIQTYYNIATIAEQINDIDMAKAYYEGIIVTVNDDSQHQKLAGLSKKAISRIKKEQQNVNDIDEVNASNQNDLEIAIADYCDSTIELFKQLMDNDLNTEVFNCIKTNYFRLLNYCKFTGNKENIIKNCLEKLKNVESEFENCKKNNETLESNSLSKAYRIYLGLDIPGSDNYDVFISYKSEDQKLAELVYEFLVSKGKKVFFSCVSLPQLGKSEYQEAIMDALHHSQHFILVSSKIQYINSNWIMYECKMFVNRIIEEKLNAQMLLLLQDDLADDLHKDDIEVYDLRYKQIIKMSNFRAELLPYLQ